MNKEHKKILNKKEYNDISEAIKKMMCKDIGSINIRLKFNEKIQSELNLYKDVNDNNLEYSEIIDKVFSKISEEMGDNFIDKEFEWLSSLRQYLLNI